MVGEAAAMRRGDIGSSMGWYLDAISDTLIGKRGMSFGPCEGASTIRLYRFFKAATLLPVLSLLTSGFLPASIL